MNIARGLTTIFVYYIQNATNVFIPVHCGEHVQWKPLVALSTEHIAPFLQGPVPSSENGRDVKRTT